MIFASLKPVILRDSDPFRQNIFSDLKSRSFLISTIERFFFLAPLSIKSWLLLGYGLKSFLDAPSLDENITGIYSYSNERRRFLEIADLFEKRSLSIRRISLNNFSFYKLLEILKGSERLPTLLSTLRYISQKHDFLVSCRLSSTIFYYLWFSGELRKKHPQAILLSSEANPYAAAITWNCRKLKIPTIYIPHGQVAPNPPRLFNDLVLLDGEVLKKTFETRGEIIGKVLYKGADGEFFPFQTEQLKGHFTVGVFLSITYDIDKLEQVIREIANRFPESPILLRLHPNEVVASDKIVSRLGDLNIKVSRNRTLSQDVTECGLVFCGNSGTHLEVLRQGKPTVQVEHLDTLPYDNRQFIVNRVVPAYRSPSEVKIDELISFYGPDWEHRMRRYDHYYGKARQTIHAWLQKEVQAWFKARQERADSDRIS